MSQLPQRPQAERDVASLFKPVLAACKAIRVRWCSGCGAASEPYLVRLSTSSLSREIAAADALPSTPPEAATANSHVHGPTRAGEQCRHTAQIRSHVLAHQARCGQPRS